MARPRKYPVESVVEASASPASPIVQEPASAPVAKSVCGDIVAVRNGVFSTKGKHNAGDIVEGLPPGERADLLATGFFKERA